jgi:hypothetical protein
VYLSFSNERLVLSEVLEEAKYTPGVLLMRSERRANDEESSWSIEHVAFEYCRAGRVRGRMPE